MSNLNSSAKLQKRQIVLKCNICNLQLFAGGAGILMNVNDISMEPLIATTECLKDALIKVLALFLKRNASEKLEPVQRIILNEYKSGLSTFAQSFDENMFYSILGSSILYFTRFHAS